MAPLIIPIFLPYLGCRERCLFCNQKTKVSEIPMPSSIRNFVEASLTKLPRYKEEKEKQIAFYGGSFTAMKKEDQLSYLKEIRPFLSTGLIDSIRISTRPDALDEEILELLKAYRVKTIELGTQSMIDEVLSLAHRGHSKEDTRSAVLRLKRWGFEIGIQLMIGLPGDTEVRFLETLDQIIALRPDFVRIHPTLVLKGAILENLWRSGEYSPMPLEEAIQWLKKGILKLEATSIPVARVGLQPTEDLEKDFLAGPYHPALHQLIDSEIFFDMAKHLLLVTSNHSQAFFQCHPKEVSNLRGQRNKNITQLKNHFNLDEIFIQEREELPRGYLLIQTPAGEASIHKTIMVNRVRHH